MSSDKSKGDSVPKYPQVGGSQAPKKSFWEKLTGLFSASSHVKEALLVFTEGVSSSYSNPRVHLNRIAKLNPEEAITVLLSLEKQMQLEKIDKSILPFTVAYMTLQSNASVLSQREQPSPTINSHIWSHWIQLIDQHDIDSMDPLPATHPLSWASQLQDDMLKLTDRFLQSTDKDLLDPSQFLLFTIFMLLGDLSNAHHLDLKRSALFASKFAEQPWFTYSMADFNFTPFASILRRMAQSKRWTFRGKACLLNVLLSLVPQRRFTSEAELENLINLIGKMFENKLDPTSLHCLANRATCWATTDVPSLLKWISWFITLANTDPEQFDITFTQLVSPLVAYLLRKCPEVTLFDSLVEHLGQSKSPQASTIKDLLFVAMNAQSLADVQQLDRIPRAFRKGMRLSESFVPTSCSDSVLDVFSDATLEEKLKLIARQPMLKTAQFAVLSSLISLLGQFAPLLEDERWPTAYFAAQDQEQLLQNVFPKLSGANASLSTVQDYFSNRSSLGPVDFYLASLCARKTTHNWASEAFAPGFAHCIKTYADPYYNPHHVRPGIVSIFYTHYLLQSLNAHIKDDFGILFKSNMDRVVPFMQWYESMLSEKYKLPELQRLAELSRPSYENFKDRIRSFLAGISYQSVTMSQAEAVRTCSKSTLESFQKILGLEEDLQEVATLAITIGNSVEEFVNMTVSLDKWFKEVGVDFRAKVIPKSEAQHKSIRELVESKDSFVAQLESAGFTTDAIETLKSFLIPSKSEIFSLVFADAKKQVLGSIKPTQLPGLVDKSCLRLKELFSDDSLLSTLNQVWTLVDKLGPTRLAKELEQLQGIVQRSKSAIPISELKSQIENGSRLLAYADTLSGLTDFLDSFPGLAQSVPRLVIGNSSLNTVAAIKSARKCLEKLDTLRVKEISSRIALVQNAIGELQPHTLIFFKTVLQHRELLVLCNRADFHNKIGILTGQIQGMAFASQLINSLSNVHSMLGPILNFEDVETLLNAVYNQLGKLTSEQLKQELRKFEICRNHISEIHTYFSGTGGDSAAAFLPTALRALKSGRYQVHSSLHPKGQSVVLQQYKNDKAPGKKHRDIETTLEGHNLHGRLRGMTVFLDRSSLKEEDVASLTQFNDCYSLVRQIAVLFEQLVRSGHPAFQLETLPVGRGRNDMTVEHYTEILEHLRAAIRRWALCTQAVCHASPRVLFLEPKAISSVLKKMYSLVQKETDSEDRIFAGLLPYVVLCFPDLCRADSPLPFTPIMLAEAFLTGETYAEMVKNFPSGDKDPDEAFDEETAYEYLMSHLGDLISEIEQHHDIYALIDANSAPKPAKPRVVKAVQQTPVELLSVVTYVCESIPHPSQILHCSRNLAVSELERFLQCAKMFPHLCFVIHGVNELTHELRQKLLNWASEASSEPNPSRAEVILLFTAERSGEDMFGFLSSETVKQPNFQFPEKTPTILAARNISSLNCLYSSQGKSTAARQFLESHRASETIELSIAENFQQQTFIRTIRKLMGKTDPLRAMTIALHIDIKPYANLPSLGRFLNDWLYFGCLYDPATGDALYPIVNGIKPDIQTGAKWSIVVELSNPMDGDVEFQHLVPKAANTTPPILSHLPAVYNLRSTAKLSDSKLCVTAEMRTLAALLSAYRTPNFTPTQVSGSNLNDAQVLAIFDQQWRDIFCLRRRHAIIELLSSSVTDFVRLYEYLGTSFISQYYHMYAGMGKAMEANQLLKKINGARSLFGLLLREALSLTDTSPSALPAPLVIRKHMPFLDPAALRNEDLMATMVTHIDWSVVYFGHPDDEFVQSCAFPVEFFYRSEYPEQRHEMRSKLRVKLAEALGVSKTDKMIRTIEQKKYVMTANLAQKMLYLNARKNSGNNVILVGDTGQGKTEMVDFYSLFLNMDSEQVPDLLGDLHALVSRFINGMYHTKLPFVISVPSEPSRGFSSVQEQANFNRDKKLAEETKTRAGLIKLLVEIAVADRPQEPPANSDAAAVIPAYHGFLQLEDLTLAVGDQDTRSCWPDLRETLKKWLTRMLHQYPLLQRTEYINLLSPLNPNNVVVGTVDLNDNQDDIYYDEDDGLELKDELAENGAAGDNPWDRKNFEEILTNIMDLRTKDLFHKQLMYRGLSLEDFSAKVEEVIASAVEWPDLTVLFFIDESNTTSYMGRLKELMVDHRWNNKPLPENVFIVAAVNPQEIDRSHGAKNIAQSRVDFSKNTAIETVDKTTSAFDVRLPHPSMEELVYHFTEMDELADDDFWESMIALGDSEIFEEERRTVIEYVLLGHRQIRKALIVNMHPSIRDLVRALRLFKYFRRSTFGSILLEEVSLDQANARDVNIDKRPFSAHFWKALFMTVAVGYCFRLHNLPSVVDKKPSPNTREALIREINLHYERDTAPKVHSPDFNFKSVVSSALKFLFDHTEIPSAIAATGALLENLFCTVVCVDMKMPLTISGPAGVSKTLSFTIATENMRGRGASRPLYKFCQQMHHFRYQCSPMSTDDEIVAVYNEASSRQAGIASVGTIDVREMCTVLLDELNLAENGSSQPLKVIHGKLDHPRVMTVILTNKLLDPAKTNRTLQVVQVHPNDEDYDQLARSCLFEGRLAPRVPAATDELNAAIVSGSRIAFTEIRAANLSMKFELRDFVYFLRSLRNSCKDSLYGQFHLTSENLLDAIVRNFSGVQTRDEELFIVRKFFDTINREIDTSGPHLAIPPLPDTPTATLRESVADVIPLTETNPNINSCRYMLVLDPTDSCTSVDLLFEMGITSSENSIIIACPEFEDDATEEGVNERVMRMKDAMANGDTVILVAANGIFGNFYDLFNKHFMSVPTDNAEGKDGHAGVTFFSNVAVGSISRPCRVHPKFKVIVHLPLSQLKNTPLPFLSRFEKYVLSIDACLAEKIQLSGLIADKGRTQLDAIISGVSHFHSVIRDKLPGQFALHGCLDEQTILSLAMCALDASPHGNTLDPVTLPRIVRDGTADDTPPAPARAQDAGWVQHLIMMTNFRLLQLARPDAMMQMRFLPEDYMKEYYIRQDHLSASNLIRHLLQLAEEDVQPFCRKWVISTRSSGVLSRLHLDPNIQKGLVADPSQATFMSVSNITAIGQFCKEMQEFIASKKPVLIITADMRTRTTSQINDLRREIDNQLREEKHHPHVFFLLHHPPEHSQSPHSAYPAIFWNKWDFYYVDSIGIISTNDEAIVANNKQGEDADVLHDDMIISQVDAREWVAKSAGLDVEVTRESVLSLFSGLFKMEFPSVLRLLAINTPPDARKKLSRSTQIYTASNIPQLKQQREKRLLELFNTNPALVNIMLSQFANYWSDSLLHKIVQGTCDAIRDGKSSGGYIPLIRNSLRFMLISVCKELLSNLLSNLNMEGIMQMLEESENEETSELAELKTRFVHGALKLVPPPSIQSILAASQVDDTTSSGTKNVFHVKLGKCVITSLPLFDLVAKSLSQLVSTAMQTAGISSLSENLDIFVQHFSFALHSSDKAIHLTEVLKLVDSHDELRTRFFDDFLYYHLELPRLSEELTQVIRSVLNVHLRSTLSQIQITPAALFAISQEVSHSLSHIGLCLTPLAPLALSKEDIETFHSEDRVNGDGAQMEVYIHTLSLSLLWLSLLKEVPEELEEDGSARLWNWFIAFRDLHVRITSARLQKSCRQQLLHWYHSMLLLFQTVRSFELTPREFYDLVVLDRKSGQKGVLSAEMDGLQSSLSYVEHIASLVASLRDLDYESSESIVEGKRTLMQHMLSGGISFDMSVHERVDASRTFRANVKLFLQMIVGLADISTSLKGLIPEQWYFGQLAGLVSQTQNIEAWRRELEVLTVECLKYTYEERLGYYAPFVPILTGAEGATRDENGNALTPDCKWIKPHQNPYNPLEVMWFLTYSNFMQSLTWDALLVLYDQFAGGNRVDHLQRVACSTALIKCLASALASPQSFLDAQAWIRRDINFIKTELLAPLPVEMLLQRGLPGDSLAFLFSQIKSMEGIEWLLSSEDVLSALGLEQWHVAKGNSTDLRQFRWMHINNPPDRRYAMYKAICAQLRKDSSATGTVALMVELDKFLDGKVVPAANAVYDLRMCLFLAIFYNFMSKGCVCDIVSSNLASPAEPLARKLSLTEMEIRAFLFISRGPRAGVHPNNDVAQHFSAETYAKYRGFGPEAQLLVNNMAVALGMPSDSNHMYPLAFDSTSLSFANLMVGSTYKKHADCGFQADFVAGQPVLQPSTILANLPRHRLALNSSYWCAFTWSFLLDPARAVPHAINRTNHVLNYVGDESHESATNYVFHRAYRFTFALESEHPDGDKPLDPIFYSTETLSKLQSVVNAANRNVAWRSTFTQEPQLDAYHAALQSEIYLPVDSNLEYRIKSYLDELAASDNILKYIIDLRSRPLVKFGLALPPANAITTWISQKRMKLMQDSGVGTEKMDIQIDGQAGEMKSLLDYTEGFLALQVPLLANRLIPAFANYLEVLSSVIDGRFTEQELSPDNVTLSLADALERLRDRKMESEEMMEKLYTLTDAFIENVKVFKSLIPILDGCGIVNRQFEYEVAEVSLDTPVALLLQVKQSDATNGVAGGAENTNFDRIRSMIKNLVDRHNACLTDRDNVRVDNWNAEGRLYGDDSKRSVSISALHHNASSQNTGGSEQNFAIITGDLTLVRDRGSSDLKMPMCSPIFSFIVSHVNPETGEVAWRKVAEHIAATYTGGRNNIIAMRELPITRMKQEHTKQEQERMAVEAERVVYLNYVNELQKSAEELREMLPPTFAHAENRPIWKSRLRLASHQLHPACKHFHFLINHLIKKHRSSKEDDTRMMFPIDLSNDMSRSIEDLEKAAGLEPFGRPGLEPIFRDTAHYLCNLAMYLVESFHEYRFLFIDADREPFESDLPLEMERYYSAFLTRLHQRDNLSQFLESLSLLSTKLGEEKALVLAKYKTPADPLAVLLKDDKDFPPNFVEELLPEGVQILHFTTMLRKFKVISGECVKLLQARAPVATAKDLYEELIPDHFVYRVEKPKKQFVDAPAALLNFEFEDTRESLFERLALLAPEKVSIRTEDNFLQNLVQKAERMKPSVFLDVEPKAEPSAPAVAPETSNGAPREPILPFAFTSNPAPMAPPQLFGTLPQSSQPPQFIHSTMRDQNPTASSNLSTSILVETPPRTAISQAYNPFSTPPQLLDQSYQATPPMGYVRATPSTPAATSQPPTVPYTPPSTGTVQRQPSFPNVSQQSPVTHTIQAHFDSPLSASTTSSPLSASSASVDSSSNLRQSKLVPEGPLGDFIVGWRNQRPEPFLTSLAKALTNASQSRAMARARTQLQGEKACDWARADGDDFATKDLDGHGTTYLHVALITGNSSLCLFTIDRLLEMQVLPTIAAQSGGPIVNQQTPASLALAMVQLSASMSLPATLDISFRVMDIILAASGPGTATDYTTIGMDANDATFLQYAIHLRDERMCSALIQHLDARGKLAEIASRRDKIDHSPGSMAIALIDSTIAEAQSDPWDLALRLQLLNIIIACGDDKCEYALQRLCLEGKFVDEETFEEHLLSIDDFCAKYDPDNKFVWP